MNSRFIFIKTKVLQIWCKVFRDITKYSNNYRNNIKFMLWVHNLEVTYQKSINIDIIVDFLHNVNVSSATKFNNSVQLIRLFQITRSGLLYGILVAVLIEIFHQFSLSPIFFTNLYSFKSRYLSLEWFFVMIAFRMYLAKASWRRGRQYRVDIFG